MSDPAATLSFRRSSLMDLGGASSSEEDEDLPIGIAVATTAEDAVVEDPPIAGRTEDNAGLGGDVGVASASLARAIAAAGAAVASPAADIDYVALAAGNPALAAAERAILRQPYDTRAWESLCGLAQNLSLDRARPLYERFLRRFPTAGRYWKYYADHEYRNGDPERAEAVLERGLASTVSCELWRYFTLFKRDVLIGSAPGGSKDAPALLQPPTAEAYDATEAAFGRALDEVGGSIDALPLWQSFIDFFVGRLDAALTQFDQGNIQNKLRGVYQRAIKQVSCS